MRKCPNCGNADPATILDNGERSTSPDLTLLCIRRVSEDVTSYDLSLVEPDASGLYECGWQWEPNADKLEKWIDRRHGF